MERPDGGTTEQGAALARLAETVRALVRATVTTTAPTGELDAASVDLDGIVRRLEAHVGETPVPRYPTLVPPPTEPADLMPYDFVLGRLNPLAPPLGFAWEDGRTVAHVTYGTAYEGPPGCVHGGVIAAAFDQVLSLANVVNGAAGPTAKLELRFRRPTPLHVPVRYEGWQTRVAGRRLHVEGRLLVEGEVTVEAEGIFVSMPHDRVMRMLDP
jgi:acyl-coenzyme A thioesterase PaaI-like protein